MVRLCERNFFFRAPVLASVICLSVRHLIYSLTTRRNLTKLATSLPLKVRLYESNIIFPCVRPFVRASIVRPFVRHTISSLTTGRNSTKLATSLPLMIRVWCSKSVLSSFVHLSVTLSPPKPLCGIQPNLLHRFPSWLGCARASIVGPFVRHAISS